MVFNYAQGNKSSPSHS